MKVRNVVRQMFTLLAVTLIFVCNVQAQESGDGYVYQAESNTYTISRTSGNITEALTNALEAAKGTRKNPATIRIQKGNYNISLVKLTKSNIVIDATGASLSFIGSQASGQFVIKATDASISNITIKGGVWDGNDKASVVFNFAGSSVKVSNIQIKDCQVKESTDTNIKFNKASNVTLDHVTVSDANYGLVVTNSNNFTFTGCRASDNTFGYGIRSLKGTNKMKDCVAEENETDGLQVKEKGTVLTVEGGDYTENEKNGISVTSGASLTLLNANVSNNDSNGISPVGKKGQTTVVTIKNTTFKNNGRHGVAADSYITINMDNCVASNNKANGIILNKYCKSSGLTNITANGNGKSQNGTGGCGILVQAGSTCSKITNATCNKNKKLGISLENVKTTLSKCQTNNNGKHGIFISGTSKNKITIKECDSSKNKGMGISISKNKSVTVTKTTACDNGVSGLETYAKTTKIAGKGNKFTGNKKHGLACREGNLNVSKAVITDNGVNGIHFAGSKVGGYCTNSTINNNQSGIVLTDGAVITQITSNTISGNTKYGIGLYQGSGSRKTNLKACKKNTFVSGKKSDRFIAIWEDAKAPSKLKMTFALTISDKVKAGQKKITGTFTPGAKVSVKIDKKTYTAKADKKGNFTIKTGKLKKGTALTVYAQDAYKNKFIGEKQL